MSGVDSQSDAEHKPHTDRFPLTLSTKHHFVPFEGLEDRLKAPHAKDTLRNAFTDPPANLFLVRGPNYLSEGKGGKNLTHLKIPSKEPFYELVGVNMFRTPHRFSHIAHEVGPVRRYLESNRLKEPPHELFPQFLLINWLMSPLFGWGKSHIVQHVFRLRKFESKDELNDSGLESALRRFLHGNDDERNTQLKYMFRIVDAPSTVKGAISMMGGERPVLIGKALTTTYHRGENYLEINSDVSSSKIASAINGTVLKNVESLVMDCSWLLEAQYQEELPERLLCKIRWIWNCAEEVMVDLNAAGERS